MLREPTYNTLETEVSYETQMDREEARLIEMLNSGLITQEQFRKQMREMQRDYQAAAEESAQRAYDDEMARW